MAVFSMMLWQDLQRCIKKTTHLPKRKTN
ncbi:hypothetical protein MTR67_008744 [Solanum verrucosum]|uniref:Uncharacterized protein n=1 Tax=Solanum verrucosum TaxID=315347 RepID=A0AAF0Q202_SOLVR|nr:hypothetical protein MTR67_008744 [Solanum verrucosum]